MACHRLNPRNPVLAAIVAAAFSLSFLFAHAAPAGASEAYRVWAINLLQSAPSSVQFRSDLEAHLDALASRARAGDGRAALTADPLLREAARAQALEMLLGDYVGHESKSGYRFRNRFEAFGGDERGSFAENAARDSKDGAADTAKASRLFQQWLDSRGHRRNLMHRDYRFVSTGVVQRGHLIYAVQIYWER
jgi:uncharacterized protein YkwD